MLFKWVIKFCAILLCSFKAHSQPTAINAGNDFFAMAKEIPCLMYTYQQQEYLSDDLLGDLLLAESMKGLKRSIKNELKNNFGKKKLSSNQNINNIDNHTPAFCYEHFPSLTNDIFGIPTYAENNIQTGFDVIAFNKDSLTEKFIQVVEEYKLEHGVAPTVGLIQDWSKEFKQSYRRNYPLTKITSKLLYCLVRGVCSQFLITGHERTMLDYIFSQPDRSIAPESLFQKGLQLTEGNVALALITIENILSRYWLAKDREQLLLTQKLIPFKNSNDTFGHWYHLFGIMVYGYEKSAFTAAIIGTTEQMGSIVLSGFRDLDRMEGKINRQGGSVGAKLRKHIKLMNQ